MCPEHCGLFRVVGSIASPCSRPNPERMAPGLVGLTHERRRPCSVRWLLSRFSAREGSTGEVSLLFRWSPFFVRIVSRTTSPPTRKWESGPSRRGQASVNAELG